jgi:hypothetical protein
VIIHLRDLVTCCTALMYSHQMGPEYHIFHTDEEILLLIYTPQPTPVESKRHLFGNPITV